jgi:hypothetical protein
MFGCSHNTGFQKRIQYLTKRTFDFPKRITNGETKNQPKIKKEKNRNCFNLPGIIACAVIPLIGGWLDFEDGWLIKSSFITKDEHKVCKMTNAKK